jgi:23S rRNA (cytidine1920-2'-O)/16S rRNA (cytidine1409-2'-O)-methyltransferase
MALIKPQFECGKAIADKFKGVILNPKIHIEIIQNVTTMASEYGFNLINISSSPIKGGDGNIEYISYFSNKQLSNDIDVKAIVNQTFDKNH